MEENNIVKYEGGLIKRISNQIGVTNKLMALGERSKILELFISHPEFFKKRISAIYSIK